MKKILNLTMTLVLISAMIACNTETKTEDALIDEKEATVETSQEEAKELADDNLMKRYYLKSGVLKFKMEGTAKGTSELYFDNWGMKEAEYEKSTMEIMGQATETDKVTLMLEKDVYSVDFTTKVGSKTPNPLFSMADDKTDLVEFGKNMLKQMGGQKTGTEDVLGFECEIWEMQGAKVWIYEGVTLKSEIDMMGMKMIKEPVEVKFDIDVPEDKFAVPEDIEFKEVSMPMMQ